MNTLAFAFPSDVPKVLTLLGCTYGAGAHRILQPIRQPNAGMSRPAQEPAEAGEVTGTSSLGSIRLLDSIYFEIAFGCFLEFL